MLQKTSNLFMCTAMEIQLKALKCFDVLHINKILYLVTYSCALICTFFDNLKIQFYVLQSFIATHSDISPFVLFRFSLVDGGKSCIQKD